MGRAVLDFDWEPQKMLQNRYNLPSNIITNNFGRRCSCKKDCSFSRELIMNNNICGLRDKKVNKG